MARRKKKKGPGAAAAETVQPAEQGGVLAHQPFSALRGLKIEPPPPEEEPVKRPMPSGDKPARVEDDASLFESAMAEVLPLRKRTQRIGVSWPRPPRHREQPLVTEDQEVVRHLRNLVDGRLQFDIVDTDEYLEGYIRGLSPTIVEKLRLGRFSVQAYLDLHGLTVREAEEAVRDFIFESVSLRYRCILLIHGRGLNSKDQIPVLKKKLETILLRGPARKHILAFTTARPVDGGAGASYVLLRAKRR